MPTLISCHYKYDAHAALLAEEGDDEVGDQATEASPAASSPLCMYANSHVVLVEVEPSNPGEAATVENLSLRAQRIAEVEQQSTEQVENRSSGELARQQGHSMSTDRILRYAFLTSDNSPLVLLHDLKARQPEKQADIIGANGGFHARSATFLRASFWRVSSPSGARAQTSEIGSCTRCVV